MVPSWSSERGDIVIGWLTRVVVVVALVGVVLFDGISVGVNRLNVEDQAQTAALAAADAWHSTHDVQKAYDAATEAATQADPLNTVGTKDFKVDADGTVHLTVTRDAATLVLHRIKPARAWVHVEGHGASKGSV